jgi:hypothetical protein
VTPVSSRVVDGLRIGGILGIFVGGANLIHYALARAFGNTVAFGPIGRLSASWVVGLSAAGIVIALLAPHAGTAIRRYASYAFGGIVAASFHGLSTLFSPAPMDAEDYLVLAGFGVVLGCSACYIVDRLREGTAEPQP